MKKVSFITSVLLIALCLVMIVGGCGVLPNNTYPNNVPQRPNVNIVPPLTDGDTDGPFVGGEQLGDPNKIFMGSTNIAQGSLVYGTLTGDVVIGSGDVGAVIPADVKVSEGASNFTLSIKNVENTDADFGDAQLVQSFDVHIDGVASDNTVPMMVNLGKVLTAGMSATELKLYHLENGVPTLMTRVNSTNDFAIHNQYVYNAETGEVSIYVASFSVFTAVNATVSTWDGETADTSWYNDTDTTFTLTTAEQFVGFRNLVDGGNTFAGKTVALGVDVDLGNHLFDPIGYNYAHLNGQVFMGTFDGQNHTVYNLYQNGWDLDPDKTNYSTYTYSTAGGGLFASIKDATIKNLAVSGANIVFECVDMGIVVGYAQGTCHFENIVVTNSKIANYNRATGGVVGEVCFGEFGTDVANGYSHTFENVVVDSSVKISSLWGSFDTLCGGVIGGKWGNATVSMTNVVVAAELDVFSDVTAAYQWYAYRRCGMLIGHTEQNSPKRAEQAAAPFLTCDNVTVYYGDWVNYHYYQYANQDSGTGRNYPWVRAEKGEHNEAFSNPRYGVPTHDGVKVSGLENSTDYTPIVFDQLYGGGQGVYGTANHEGVRTYDKNTKTIYLKDVNEEHASLTLTYWHQHGDNTWTTVDPDGIALNFENGICVITVPSYASAFEITVGEDTIEFEIATLADNETITLEGEHVHVYTDNACACGSVKFEFGENGDTGHAESTKELDSYTETTGEYTLTLTGLSKVYGSSKDEDGNSALKLGSSSGIATLTFAVPENVEKVIIYAAKYKDNDSAIKVNNGTEHVLENSSNAGLYDEIVIDTTSTKTITIETVTGKTRCMINTIVFIATRLDHEHNYESVITDPTCTEDGYTTYTCTICEHSYQEAGEKAPGHVWDEGVVVTEATCTENGELKISCTACNEFKTEPIQAPGHKYVDGVCDVCGAAQPTENTWELVTDVADLKAGDTIVIVAKDSNVALSTTQSNNNRGQANVTKSGDTVTFGKDVQIITLEAGTITGTFAFNVEDGYLYAASSSSNYLKTQTKKDDNGSWLITIEADGTASIVAQGTNSHNILRHNSSSSLFACYTSGQKDVVIYTSSVGGTTPDPEIPTCTDKCETCGKCTNDECEICTDKCECTPPCEHANTTTATKDATCTEDGSTTVTCIDCGETVSTETIPATGHNYVGGTCSACGVAQPAEPTGFSLSADFTTTASGSKTPPTDWTLSVKSGSYASLWQSFRNNAEYFVSPTFAAQSSLEVTLRIYLNNTGTSGNTSSKLKFEGLDAAGNALATVVSDELNTLKTGEANATDVKATLAADGIVAVRVTMIKDGGGNIAFSTISIVGASQQPPAGEQTCQHTNKTTTTIDATCTEAGSTTVTCDDCGEVVSTEEISALGHTTDNGVCERCGETISGEGGGEQSEPITESMNVYANKGVTGTKTISWAGTNFTLTNNQAGSSTPIRTSDTAEYRIYQNSELVVSTKETDKKITKIVITCTSSSYANVLKTSAGANATADGSVVTITLTEDTTELKITMTAQVRINKIEVTVQ